MLINNATFNERREAKRPRMTHAEVAKKAGVSPRTVSKIKTGADINRRTVENIARALDMTVNELCAPPVDRAGARTSNPEMDVQLAAFRYNVSPEVIEGLAPIMFVAISELALKRRRDRLEAWWDKVNEARELAPEFTPESNAEMDATSGLETLRNAYRKEMEEIEAYRLDCGDDDKKEDHFFAALASILGGSNEYKFQAYYNDGWSDETFMADPGNLKAIEGSLLTHDVFLETTQDVAGTRYDLYNPLDDDTFRNNEYHPIAEMAEQHIFDGTVDISKLPVDLRRHDKALDRAVWIASRDGQDPIPDVYYHWESVVRIEAVQHYQEEIENLTIELESISGDEQRDIEAQLEAYLAKKKAWEALIEPDDAGWYEKWLAYRERDAEGDARENS